MHRLIERIELHVTLNTPLIRAYAALLSRDLRALPHRCIDSAHFHFWTRALNLIAVAARSVFFLSPVPVQLDGLSVAPLFKNVAFSPLLRVTLLALASFRHDLSSTTCAYRMVV